MNLSKVLQVPSRDEYRQAVQFVANTRALPLSSIASRYVLSFDTIDTVKEWGKSSPKQSLSLSEWSLKEIFETFIIEEECTGFVRSLLYKSLEYRPDMTLNEFLYLLYLNTYAFHYTILGRDKKQIIIAENIFNADTYYKISVDSLYDMTFFKEVCIQFLKATPCSESGDFFGKVMQLELLPELNIKVPNRKNSKKREQYFRERYKECKPYLKSEVIIAQLVYPVEVLNKFFAEYLENVNEWISMLTKENYTEIFKKLRKAVLAYNTEKWYLSMLLLKDDTNPQLCCDSVVSEYTDYTFSPLTEIYNWAITNVGCCIYKGDTYVDAYDSLVRFREDLKIGVEVSAAIKGYKRGAETPPDGKIDNIGLRYDTIEKAVAYLQCYGE